MTRSYPGGKGGAGTYQKIINQMPPHAAYIEAFLGGGAILRAKRPAAINIGIDVDAGAIAAFDGAVPVDLVCADALEWLGGSALCRSASTLVYLDPPYLMSTRSSKRRIYQHEMSADDHRRLLELISSLPCMVMISGYWSDLYGDHLWDWRCCSWQAVTRGGGLATEYLWMNYPEPAALHDYRFLGSNYRERERITRKKKRWVNKLANMPALERYALLSAIQDWGGPGLIAAAGGIVDRDGAISPDTPGVKNTPIAVDAGNAGEPGSEVIDLWVKLLRGVR